MHPTTMSGYPVYRIDLPGTDPVRIGTILEFRRSRRSMNRLGLAKLAQKIFSRGPGDIIIIGSDSSLERERFSREYQVALSAG